MHFFVDKHFKHQGKTRLNQSGFRVFAPTARADSAKKAGAGICVGGPF
jgi:hypothetical protein